MTLSVGCEKYPQQTLLEYEALNKIYRAYIQFNNHIYKSAIKQSFSPNF